MNQVFVREIHRLPKIIGNKKTLLVHGHSFSRLPIAGSFSGLNAIEFSDFSPNPLYEQVCKAVRIFNEQKCDAIIAVGGGSAIDVAKCVKLFASMDPTYSYLEQKAAINNILLCAIPTTAGSGSESTKHAVIYYKGIKQSISDRSILPTYAFLEPCVLKGLPLYQKKSTLLDALCQGIESFWSVNRSKESQTFSETAIRLIRDHYEEYLFHDSCDAAEAVMIGANASGQAINLTATTAAHAMSYKLSSLYRITHGHAAALCLPEVWDIMNEQVQAGNFPELRPLFTQLESILTVSEFRRILQKLEMPYPVSSQRAADLDELTSTVNPLRLKNNPIPLNRETIYHLYERIVKA